MTLSSSEIRRLCDQFSLLHDDGLDWTEQEALARRINEEPDVRELYLRYMRLAAGLQWDLGGVGREPLPLHAPAPAPRASFTARLPEWSQTFWRRPVAYLSLVVVVFWTFGLAFLGAISLGPPNAFEPMEPPSSSAVVARLTGEREAVWQDEAEPSLVAPFLARGRQLTLQKGLSEITFIGGAVVIVQAPATLVCDAQNGLDLLRGKIFVRVANRAQGFTVQTPSACVVDLGTQFGVEVDPSGATATHVFEGKVAVQARSADRSSTAPREAVAGQSVLVTPQGNLAPPPPHLASRFATQLPTDKAVHPPRSAHAQRVLAHHPVLYYPMEPLVGDILFDSGTAKRPVSFRQGGASEPMWAEGAFGHALNLRGFAAGDHALVSSYPKAEDGRLTVSAWAWADSRPEWATIAKNWTQKFGQFHLGLDDASGVLSAYVTQTNGVITAARETAPFPLQSWQHVALVVDGHELRLYREGQLVAATPCQGVQIEPTASPLGIGVKPVPELIAARQPGVAGFWHGRLDEIAIFNQALAPDEIAELAPRDDGELAKAGHLPLIPSDSKSTDER